MDTAEFVGRERRRHKVFVTRNTEYHVRDRRVIAVRPRGTTEWATSHAALGMTVDGLVREESPVPLPGEPRPGERLYLTSTAGRSVVTSTVISVERPPKADVITYPAQAA